MKMLVYNVLNKKTEISDAIQTEKEEFEHVEPEPTPIELLTAEIDSLKERLGEAEKNIGRLDPELKEVRGTPTVKKELEEQ